jgi:hypothetical protein
VPEHSEAKSDVLKNSFHRGPAPAFPVPLQNVMDSAPQLNAPSHGRPLLGHDRSKPNGDYCMRGL